MPQSQPVRLPCSGIAVAPRNGQVHDAQPDVTRSRRRHRIVGAVALPVPGCVANRELAGVTWWNPKHRSRPVLDEERPAAAAASLARAFPLYERAVFTVLGDPAPADRVWAGDLIETVIACSS